MLSTYIYLLPHIFLLLAITTMLLVGVFQRPASTENNIHLPSFNFVYFGIIAALFGTSLLVGLDQHNIDRALSRFDIDTDVLLHMVIFSSIIVLLTGYKQIKASEMARFEYPIFMGFSAVGMMLMITASDFLMLYMGLELQSLSLYLMAAFKRDNIRTNEAAVKYFVLGSLSSAFLLYGISFVYAAFGDINFAAIASQINADTNNIMTMTALVLIIVAFAFKLAAAPFHMWSPDVYDGVPMPVLAFFSTAPKVAAISVVTILLTTVFGNIATKWQLIIVLLSVFSIMVGSYAAVVQSRMQRLLAYSSIGHVGFMLMGIAAGANIELIITYVLIYVVANLGLFAVLLNIKVEGRPLKLISELQGFAKRDKYYAFLIAVFMLSFAGIPPLAGFLAKFLMFYAAISANSLALLMLAVVAAIFSVVAAFYYIRIIKVMYFDEASELDIEVEDNKLSKVIATAMALMLILANLVPVILS